MTVTNKIAKIRETKGMSKADMAKALDMNFSNYHRLEGRGNKLTIEQVSSIAKVLGVSLIELLTWGEEKEIQEPAVDEYKEVQREMIRLQGRMIEYLGQGVLRTILNSAWYEFANAQDLDGNYLYTDYDSDPKTHIMFLKFDEVKWEQFLSTYLEKSDLVERLVYNGVVKRKDLTIQNLNSIPKPETIIRQVIEESKERRL